MQLPNLQPYILLLKGATQRCCYLHYRWLPKYPANGIGKALQMGYFHFFQPQKLLYE